LAQNLSIDLVDLRLVPWNPAFKPSGPNPPSYIRIPGPPVLYKNVAMIVTACCADTQIENSVSVLVPAGSFSSFTSQDAANQAAYDYWYPLMQLELNCTEVITNVVTGTPLGVVQSFTEEQAGGTWLSDPWELDSYIENEYTCS
jgi:hypothetical protein